MCRCRGLAPAFATEDPALKFTGGLGGNVDVDEVRRVEVVQLVLKGVGPALVGVDLHEDVGLSDGGLFLDVPRVVVAECLRCVEPVQESDQRLDFAEFDDLADGVLVAAGDRRLDLDETLAQFLDLPIGVLQIDAARAAFGERVLVVDDIGQDVDSTDKPALLLESAGN